MAKGRKSKKQTTTSKKVKANIAVPSQKNQSHYCCPPASKNLGWLFLVIGLLFLLTDLGITRFWTINWYTLLFIFIGLWMIKK